MSVFSQRTVVQLERVLNCLTRQPRRHTPSLISTAELWRRLYARDFSRHLLDVFRDQYHWNFGKILTRLHDGTLIAELDNSYNENGELIIDKQHAEAGRLILLNLTESAISITGDMPQYLDEVIALGDALNASAEMDGFTMVSGKLIPSATAVFDQPQQVAFLQRLIVDAASKRRDTALYHYANGEDAYVARKYDTATGEWRKFLETVIRDIAEETAANRADLNQPAAKVEHFPMADVLAFLRRAGFLDDDLNSAMGGAWGFLCSGNHPGVGEQHEAYLAMTLALSFGQVLIEQLVRWRKGAFRSFPPLR